METTIMYKINKVEELFSIKPVITYLKFKFAVNLQCFSLKAQSKKRDRIKFCNKKFAI